MEGGCVLARLAHGTNPAPASARPGNTCPVLGSEMRLPIDIGILLFLVIMRPERASASACHPDAELSRLPFLPSAS